MQFGGEPVWVEVPSDKDLLDEGIAKRELKNGGNYIHCIKNEFSTDITN